MTQEFELELYVRIHEVKSSGHLEVNERFRIDATGFLEIAGILHKFHELAEKIKSAEEVE